MDWLAEHILSGLVFLPFVWGIIGLLLPNMKDSSHRVWAFVGSLGIFLLSLYLYFNYDPAGAEFQFVEKTPWITAWGVQYNLGLDGISLWLVILTTFLTPLIILGSFTAVEQRQREFYFLMLALESGMLGAFVSLDAFLFYVFWEVMLIPMYLLIGVWGGKNRIYASMKFFLYTVVGSLLMLVAIFYLSYQHKLQFNQYSTALLDLYKLQLAGDGWFSVQAILFLAFSFAFAIKVPLFPLHTWLPDAHVEAPTAGSVVLAGVLLKLGGYGFIRFAFPLFPSAVIQYQMVFLTLSAIAIVYGAWVAMVQPDIKKLVAYSSVSHMGYVVLGLFSLNMIGVTGSVYQMLNHGISTGALFLLVGMIYERRHTREISDFGGIAKLMPLFAIVFMIITLSSVALPGTNGFIGEFLILLGAWLTHPVIAIVAATGVVFGAVYMLWMFRRVMFGPVTHKENESLKDLTSREILVLVPFIFMVFFMGVYPNLFFGKMEPSVQRLITKVMKPKNLNTQTAAVKVEQQNEY
ncbi:MAG: NADH-quinone oxidoreductase subunit M [Xanthomonadaceae bacterium]|nr:NADH-quinone oxidoreductase subunit M [Xanthomonadaceae bacterium]